MTAHLSRGELEAFARKTLPAADLLAASRHLTECSECASRLRAHTGSAGAPSLGEEDDEGHLSYEQIAAYVDGALSTRDRAEVDAHASQCRHCAEDLAQLRVFAARMNVRPQVAAVLEPTWWERFRSLLRVPQIAMAASALVVATVLTGSFVLIHNLGIRPAEQVATARPAAPASSPPSEPLLSGVQDLPASHRDAIAAAVRGESQTGGFAALSVPDDTIEQARRKDPDAHLLLGALYQQRGMWADAEREYRLLLDANPGSEVARKLWRNARKHAKAPH